MTDKNLLIIKNLGGRVQLSSSERLDFFNLFLGAEQRPLIRAKSFALFGFLFIKRAKLFQKRNISESVTHNKIWERGI